VAVPKRKTSKARQRSRSANFRVAPPHLVECPQCHKPKLPHRLCPACGYYHGREVVKVKKES
jgi:large subunit ribosomal protein L32